MVDMVDILLSYNCSVIISVIFMLFINVERSLSTNATISTIRP